MEVIYDWCSRKKTEGYFVACHLWVLLLAEVVDEQVVLKDTDPLPGW